jgi:sorting nexin-4
MNASEFTDEPIDDEPPVFGEAGPSIHDKDMADKDTSNLAAVHDNEEPEPVQASHIRESSPAPPPPVPEAPEGNTHSSESLHIHSKVVQPQKESDGQNAYISYLIETESNNPVFQSDKFIVRRRFSDFYFLYHVLLNDFPACVVPPLPDKQRLEYLKGDRFGPDFTLKRASSLSRFLDRISLHPILKKAKIYHVFLESHDWNSYRASVKVKGSIADVNTAADGISDVFINAFKSTSAQNQEFLEIRERADKLDENITKIDRIFNKVLKRHADLEQDYFDFSLQVKRLAELEPELQLPFLKFSDGLNSLSIGFQSLKTFLDNEYIISLKDLEHYVSSVKNLLKLKDQKQIDYEALTEYLNKSINDKNTLLSGGGSNFFTNKFEELTGVNHDLARKQKIIKLENKIESLTKEVDIAKNIFESFEKQAIHEVQYFENIKTVELKSTLGDLADTNIKFYKDMIEKWSRIEKDLSD